MLGKNFLLTDNQKKWIEQKKLSMIIQPKIRYEKLDNVFREKLHILVMRKEFEILILICIVLNTLSLAINWYSQPVFVDTIMNEINYGFALIFLIEAILKLIAFGPRVYFLDNGNRFDISIVLISIVSSVFSFVTSFSLGASTTFIRALRISRIFNFIHKSKQVKIIFETLIVTVPALANIGGLLLLFFYLYSILGVFLFSEVQL